MRLCNMPWYALWSGCRGKDGVLSVMGSRLLVSRNRTWWTKWQALSAFEKLCHDPSARGITHTNEDRSKDSFFLAGWILVFQSVTRMLAADKKRRVCVAKFGQIWYTRHLRHILRFYRFLNKRLKSTIFSVAGVNLLKRSFISLTDDDIAPKSLQESQLFQTMMMIMGKVNDSWNA